MGGFEEFFAHIGLLPDIRRQYASLPLSDRSKQVLGEFDQAMDQVTAAMLTLDEGTVLLQLIKATQLADELATEGGEYGILGGILSAAWFSLIQELDGPIEPTVLLEEAITGFPNYLPRLQRDLKDWFSLN